MIYNSEPVNLSRIDFSDQTCRISTRKDIQPLADSIKGTGLISPLLLLEKEGGRLSLISGFRRAEACKFLNRTEAEGRILAKDTPFSDCIRYAITENAFQRALNPIEISRAFRLLQKQYDDEELLANAAAGLGLPGNRAAVRQLLPLCGLSSRIQEGILQEIISPIMALELTGLDAESADRLAALFCDLRVSLNKQREILNLVREIALRDDLEMPDVLEGRNMTDILSDPEKDRNQKARQIRLYLRKCRFPAISAAEERYAACVKELKLPKDLRLIPPKDFEGSVFCFQLYFSSIKELEYVLTQLELSYKTPAFGEIIKNC